MLLVRLLRFAGTSSALLAGAVLLTYLSSIKLAINFRNPGSSQAWRTGSSGPEARNVFPETSCASLRIVPDWSFLTNHARVLLCIAHDPGARLRDIAARLGITERSAYGIITDLVEAGYVVKQRDGRRNRYQIEANLPLREPGSREPAIGEVLAVLLGTTAI